MDKIVKGGETAENAVKMFLFDYRNFPHCTTGRSPANLMYNRDLRTRFDFLKPNVLETVEKHQRAQIVARRGHRQVDLNVGDEVLIDSHGVNDEKRVTGEIVKQTSPSTFIVKTDSGELKKRHVDQTVKPKLRRSPRLNNI